MVKRHMQARRQQNPQGGIVETEGSIAIANVALVVTPSCGKARPRPRSKIDGRQEGPRLRQVRHRVPPARAWSQDR